MALHFFLEEVEGSETNVNFLEPTNVLVNIKSKGTEQNYEFEINTAVYGDNNTRKKNEQNAVTNTHCCHY